VSGTVSWTCCASRNHSLPFQKLGLLPKSRLGNGEGTMRFQVRTYDRAGIVATTIDAAPPGSNPEAL
jgi:hypothetical protein